MDIMLQYTALLTLCIVSCHGDTIKATCEIEKTSGISSAEIEGTLNLNYDEDSGEMKITGSISGFDTSDDVTQHGFHIHEKGDLSNQCGGAGSHYNPTNKAHGRPSDAERHVGDLGNIVEDSNGVAKVDITDTVAKLAGDYKVQGKAIVVHALPDDFGQPVGNAGGRLGCCIITLDSSGSKMNYSITSMLSVLALYFLFLR